MFLADTNLTYNRGTGVLIAVPIPKEYASAGNFVESAIQRALGEAE